MFKDPKNVIILALVSLVIFLVMLSSGALGMSRYASLNRAYNRDRLQRIKASQEKQPTAIVPTDATTTTVQK